MSFKGADKPIKGKYFFSLIMKKYHQEVFGLECFLKEKVVQAMKSSVLTWFEQVFKKV
jgi:hypothetical protein